jgi:O-antigen/teichoic acid export membrane protein
MTFPAVVNKHTLVIPVPSATKRFLLELGAYGGSVVLLQGLRFGISVVCAGIVSPPEWGLWTLLNSVLAYSFVADLGISNGMNRDIPLYRGAGNRVRAGRISDASRSFALVSSVLCALGAAVYATYRGGPMQHEFLAFAGLLLLYRLFTFAQCYAMAFEDFGRVTRSNLALAALTSTVCLPLTIYFGLRGYLYSQIVTFALGGILYLKPLVSSFRWNFDREDLADLAKGGLPIAAVGITASLVTSADRWLVSGVLGMEAIGHYSLVGMVWGTMSLLPQVIATRMYPGMSSEWGANRSGTALRAMLKRYTLLGLALTVPLVAVVEVVGPLLAETFLPAYRPGIPAMQIAVLGFAFQPVVHGCACLFNVLGKQQFVFAVQTAALAGAVGLTMALFSLGYGLAGAAFASAAASGFQAAGFFVASRYVLRRLPA